MSRRRISKGAERLIEAVRERGFRDEDLVAIVEHADKVFRGQQREITDLLVAGIAARQREKENEAHVVALRKMLEFRQRWSQLAVDRKCERAMTEARRDAHELLSACQRAHRLAVGIANNVDEALR